MNRARRPWRKRFWTLIVYLTCPIGAYAMRMRARACGCINCQMLLLRPLIAAAWLSRGDDVTPVHNPGAN